MAILGTTFMMSGKALAHNTFVESDPKNGALLTAPPSIWTVTFTKPVPLSSASGEVVNGDGIRSELPTPIHSASENTIQFSLPPDLSGSVTARWRLVSVDGHVISGRIKFTINASPAISAAPTTIPLSVSPSSTVDLSAQPELTPIEDNTSNPETTRVIMRFGSYAGLILVLGMLFTEIYLANGASTIAIGRKALWTGLSLMTATSLAQTVIFLSETSKSDSSWISGVWNLFDTTPGSMLVAKVFASILCFVVIAQWLESKVHKGPQNNLVYFSIALYLFTMSYLGHSRSQDLPWLGVPVGVVHIASISIWIGGLAALIAVVLPNVSTFQSIKAFKRFSPAAEKSVLIIVVTGFIQSVRLHHDVGSLFTSSHGQLLLVKTLTVLLMVWIASQSRKSLNTSASLNEADASVLRASLRRSTTNEIAFAAIVLLITAVLAGLAPS